MAKKVKARYIGRTIYCGEAGFGFKGKKVEGIKQVPTGGLKLDEKTSPADIEKLLAAGRLPNKQESSFDYLFEEDGTATPAIPAKP